jgi:hypothetical protein
MYPEDEPLPKYGTCRGTPRYARQLRGLGGGSFCNHDDEANAKLVFDKCDDGLGVYIIATKDILRRDFIHVKYGIQFLQSKWSNLK